MDDYFNENILWSNCNDPINAIDFTASTYELEKLVPILELVGLEVYPPVAEIYRDSVSEYLTLDVKGSRVEIVSCDDRIAPVPTQYINTLIPALILAHLNDPASVEQVYNDFFINKKEEITPLLNQ